MTKGREMSKDEAVALYKTQVKRWRRTAGVFIAVVILAIVFDVAGYIQRSAEIRRLEHVADQIAAATGPEAQAEQERVIDGLVVRIDCSNRAALQEVIDQLTAQNVTVLTAECTNLGDRP